jgi:hypothetical protein
MVCFGSNRQELPSWFIQDLKENAETVSADSLRPIYQFACSTTEHHADVICRIPNYPWTSVNRSRTVHFYDEELSPNSGSINLGSTSTRSGTGAVDLFMAQSEYWLQ